MVSKVLILGYNLTVTLAYARRRAEDVHLLIQISRMTSAFAGFLLNFTLLRATIVILGQLHRHRTTSVRVLVPQRDVRADLLNRQRLMSFKALLARTPFDGA